MPRIFRKQYDVKLPLPNRESKHEEHWIEHKGVTKCPMCGNVHFLKQWYASEKDLKNRLHKKKITIAEKKICPSCRIIQDKVFAGEVIIENIPIAYKKELLNEIKNFFALALEKDPQDRVIRKEALNEGYRIITTNNETADKLAKKLHHSFHSTRLSYSRSPKPYNIDRAHVIFNKENE